MARVLVHLIGEQPIPNLVTVPAVEPDRLYLFYTDRTRSVAQNIDRALDLWPATAQVRVRAHHIADAHDLEAIEAQIDRVVGGLGDAQVTLNLTGGTKPMSLAAYRIGQRRGLPMVYLVTEGTGRLVSFEPDGRTTSRPLGLPVPIEVYLAAYGFQMRTKGALGPPYSDAAAYLGSRVLRLQRVIGACNRAFSNREPRVTLRDVEPEERQAFERLAELGFFSSLRQVDAHLDAEYGAVPEARAYLAGRWLEQYCYQLVQSAPGLLDDAAPNVEVRAWAGDDSWPERLNENEHDLIVAQRGRIAIVSCKAHDPEAEDLDQLNSVASHLRAGPYAARVLVTTVRRTPLHAAARAERYGVTIVNAESLPRLAEILQERTA